jgi:transcriptional regulator with XRE-family HTH domain
MLVGANCKGARIKTGLSQEVASQRTGILQPRISMIEQGGVKLTLETMMILAPASWIKTWPISCVSPASLALDNRFVNPRHLARLSLSSIVQ